MVATDEMNVLAAEPLAGASMEPVAVLDRVTKKYGKVTALDGLSLALRPGEIVALLGPNGAGKSTAVRLLLGLSAPTTGSARIFGADPRNPETRTRIGAMLQVASVPKTLKVKEHIDLFRSYFPAPLSMDEIVRIAQLDGIEDRLFEKLSGGQRQRLLFALAICGNPEIVFLDEPTVGMDIEARRGLWTQIRWLAAHGKTVLLTTHYLEEADALAHRIVVINRGRVVSEGTPQEVKGRFASRKIKCCTSLSTAQIWALPGVVDVEQTGKTMCITAGNPEEVLRKMLSYDEHLSDLEVIAAGLDDAFLALTANVR
jgi:ABC-2 type transport system ATP-binding protein